MQWVCTVVAAVLHYLFLCVFCWMLAEGIMLYMLVVRVFGSVAEKWYYLLLLGWGETGSTMHQLDTLPSTMWILWNQSVAIFN